MSELCFTYRQVLSDVVENWGAFMRWAGCPAACRMCCLNSIAYIFTITFTHLSDYMPSWIVDIPAVARVRPYLFAIDEHLRRAINSRQRQVVPVGGFGYGGMIHFIFTSFVCRYRLLRSIGAMFRFFGYRKAIGA